MIRQNKIDDLLIVRIGRTTFATCNCSHNIDMYVCLTNLIKLLHDFNGGALHKFENT